MAGATVTANMSRKNAKFKVPVQETELTDDARPNVGIRAQLQIGSIFRRRPNHSYRLLFLQIQINFFDTLRCCFSLKDGCE